MKRFAFDIGTQSIGWCVLEAGEEASALIDLGVRVFPDGREPGRNGRMGDPLNIKRRMARGMRRNLERRKRRKNAMFRLLKSAGYTPAEDGFKAWREMDPYLLRAEALKRALSTEEVGRVLMNMAMRRGFKSNRKTDKADSEAKGQLARQAELEKALGGLTLGQYLNGLKEQSKDHTRLRFRADFPFYPSRKMYEDEFARIRAMQEAHHPSLDWDKAYRVIFFQRPLKRPDRAPCTFYPDEKRGYSCQPSAQHFRIVQDVVNLAYLDRGGKTAFLDAEQRTMLYESLMKQKTMSFDAIRKLLKIEKSFNLEGKARDKLKGNATAVDMRKCMGGAWDALSLEAQDALVEEIILDEDTDSLKEVLLKNGCPESALDAVISIDFPSGTASVSAKFMRDCSAKMLEDWCRYDEAVVRLGLHHSDLPKHELMDELPYYGQVLRYATVLPKAREKLTEAEKQDPEMLYGRIPNPTVHIALNQLRKLVNALMARHGRPDEIVLEFATELKKGRKAMDAILKRQAENQKKNKRIRQTLIELQGRGSEYKPLRSDYRRYILWEELGGDAQTGRYCVYCGKVISASQLMNGQAEIEHIIPFARCWDDGMSNLTVAHVQCNRYKGNRTPFEAFGSSPPGYDWDAIVERAKHFDPRKRTRFSVDALERLQEKQDFLASQLTDTAYIAKASRDYLSCVSPQVWAIPGQLTAIFRDQWGFNTILSSGLGKNRSDHRHHALDAIVVGLTDRSMLQAAARVNAHEDMSRVKAPPCTLDRADVVEKLKRVLVSIKPEHGCGGALLDETAYGYRKDEQGKPCQYTVRKPISALKPAEVKGRLIDPALGTRILDYLANKGIDLDEISEKDLSKALETFSRETGIFRAKLTPKNEAGYLHLEAGRNGRQGHKAYQIADILCVDIWMLKKPTGKTVYEGAFSTRLDVPHGATEPPRKRLEGDTGATFLMRLYKNDVIGIIRNGKMIPARVASYKTVSSRLDIRPLYATDDCKSWIEKTSQGFTDSFWKPQQGQNLITINVLFKKEKENDRITKLSISVDGRLRRR